MPVTGELALDYPTYRRIVFAPGGRVRWLLPVMGVVIVLWQGTLVLSGGGLTDVVLGVAGLTMVFLPELLVLFGWRQIRRLRTQQWRYEVTAASVGIHTSQTSVQVAWSAISRARARRHAWVCTVASTRRSLVIPRAAFSPEAQAEVDRFVREHPAPSAGDVFDSRR